MSYGRLSTRFYDLCFPTAPDDALAYYLEQARHSNGPILEPMCGSGRYLLPLLAQGFDIEGSDASDEMLDRCRARAKAMKLAPRLGRSLLQHLTSARQYGLVIIPAGSFCLLTDPLEVTESLRRIHKALLPGGRFIVELERAGTLEPTLDSAWHGRWLTEPNGTLVVQNVLSQYSGVERIARALHRYELISQGQLLQTEFEEFAIRHYDETEFEALLLEAGFDGIQCFVPYERRAPTDDDEALLFECVRAASTNRRR